MDATEAGGDTAARITSLAQPVAHREGCEVVDVQVVGQGGRTQVRLFVDRPGGVTVDHCRRISDALGLVLEIEEVFSAPYVLEVSSPGICRPLITVEDFARGVGQTVEISYLDGTGAARHATAKVLGTRGNDVELETPEGVVTVPCASIKRARPVIDWGALFRAGKKRASSGGNSDD